MMHCTCLARWFLYRNRSSCKEPDYRHDNKESLQSLSPSTPPPLLPISGECAQCGLSMLWGDVILGMKLRVRSKLRNALQTVGDIIGNNSIDNYSDRYDEESTRLSSQLESLQLSDVQEVSDGTEKEEESSDDMTTDMEEYHKNVTTMDSDHSEAESVSSQCSSSTTIVHCISD